MANVYKTQAKLPQEENWKEFFLTPAHFSRDAAWNCVKYDKFTTIYVKKTVQFILATV